MTHAAGAESAPPAWDEIPQHAPRRLTLPQSRTRPEGENPCPPPVALRALPACALPCSGGGRAQVPGANHAVLIGAQGTGNFTDHFTDHFTGHFTDRFNAAPTQSLRPGNAAITLPHNAVFA